ncbi:MAG: cobalamin-binding protein [Candidatus Latescibacterota bacterium]|nr:cobalamin-binding protein [Candidatus Latescibacterota bacterium]
MSAVVFLHLLALKVGAEVDDLGNEVVLTAPPQRIVSLAPSNTELLFALGLGSRVVGVTEYCNYPPEAKRRTAVAGFSTLSAERVAALVPDLVLAARGNDLEGLESVRQLGIPVFALNVQNLRQLVEASHRVGRLTGESDAGESLATSLVLRIEAVNAAVKERRRPRVFWGYWGDPIYTAGADNIIDDVIQAAGGENVGRQAQGMWPQVSLEAVVGWAPEVIVTTYLPAGNSETAMAGEIDQLRSLNGWNSLPAVRDSRIVHMDADLLNRAGPRAVDALEQMARVLHPAEPE